MDDGHGLRGIVSRVTEPHPADASSLLDAHVALPRHGLRGEILSAEAARPVLGRGRRVGPQVAHQLARLPGLAHRPDGEGEPALRVDELDARQEICLLYT